MKPFSGWAEKVHGFHFAGIVFLALMVFQFVMSRVRPLSADWEHHHSGEVDLTPWKWAKPLGIQSRRLRVLLYLSFADFSVLKG